MKEYFVKKGTKPMMIFSVLFFGAMLLLGFALPFLEGETPIETEDFIISLLLSLIWAPLTFIHWKALKELPFSNIALDEYGIWHQHKNRNDSLIPWESIASIKERHFMQRLDLFNDDKRKLISIEYQMDNFEELRSTVVDEISDNFKRDEKSTFTKPFYYHLFYGLFLFFPLLATGSSINIPMLAISFVLVFFVIKEYLSICYKISVEEDFFHLSYPFKTIKLHSSEIDQIKLSDDFQKMQRFPIVCIFEKDVVKMHKLQKLGVDANELYRSLMQNFESQSESL